jgi:hypothetical protein
VLGAAPFFGRLNHHNTQTSPCQAVFLNISEKAVFIPHEIIKSPMNTGFYL